MSDFLARIKPKKSSTAGERPTAVDLRVGELAINTADGKIYTKHTDNQIVEMVGTGTGGGGGGGGGGAEKTTDLIDVESKRGPIPASQLPTFHVDEFTGAPTSLAEFDAIASNPGAWYFTNEFAGLSDPQFFLGQFILQGTAIDYSQLPANGNLYAAITEADQDTETYPPTMVEYTYTNLTVRGNGSVSVQIQAALLDAALEQGTDTPLTEQAIREGYLFIYFDGVPEQDIPPAVGEVLVVQENGNYSPDLLTTHSLPDMPSEDELANYLAGTGEQFAGVPKPADRSEEPLLYWNQYQNKYQNGFPDKLYRDTSYWELNPTGGAFASGGETQSPVADLDELENLFDVAIDTGNEQEPTEDYLAIPLPERMRGTKILGKTIFNKLYVTLKGRIGVWFDARNDYSGFEPPDVVPDNTWATEGVGGDPGDFLKTAGDLDLYWAITERSNCRVKFVAWRDYDIFFPADGDDVRDPGIRIRLEIAYNGCALGSQFCGIPVSLTIFKSGRFEISYGISYGRYGDLLRYNSFFFSPQRYRGLASDGQVIYGGGTDMWNSTYDRADGYFLSQFYNQGQKINDYFGSDLESLGDVGAPPDVASPSRSNGATIRWNSELRFFEYGFFTAEELLATEDGAPGQMLVRDDTTGIEVGWEDPVRRFGQLADVPSDFPEDAQPYVLTATDGLVEWTPPADVAPVTTVNGQEGDVSLGVLDLDDVRLNKVQTVGSWTWTTDSDAPGEAYRNVDELALFLNEVDAEGNPFTDGILYLIDEVPTQLRFENGDGELLYLGTVDGPISYSRGKFRIYPSTIGWTSQLTPGDRLVISVELPGAADIQPVDGDLIVYDGQNWVPKAISLAELEELSEDLDALEAVVATKVEEAPADGKQYARQDEAWAEVAPAYDDSAIDGRVTTLEGEVATLQGEVATLQGEVTTLQGNVTSLQGEVTTLESEVATLQGEVATLQTDLQAKVEEAPVDGTAYVRQDGQWLSLSAVLADLGFVPGGGGGPTPDPEIPEIVNGGNFTTGEAGSVDLTVSGGNFTTGEAGSADELVDGGLFTPDPTEIPEVVNGGNFTTGEAGSVDVVASGGNFTTGEAGSSDELIDGGVFTSDVVIPETVSGGNFTTGEAGSSDVTVSGGNFSTGEAGSVDETVDGGLFTSDVVVPETVSGGDFTTGTGGSEDITLSGGDFSTGAAGTIDETVDGGLFTGGEEITAGGGDFTSGGPGGPDVTYGGGDFTSGSSSGEDITLDGGDFGGPVSSGGDFTSGASGDNDTTFGAGDFTTGESSGEDVTLDGGDFSA